MNHAREIKFLAARRIGELVPATPAEVKGKRAHGKELSEVRTTQIPRQRLSEFRKLAEIPIKEFRRIVCRRCLEIHNCQDTAGKDFF